MNDEQIGASLQASANKELLAELVNIAKGDRTIEEMMEDTGLSRSTLSKLLNASTPGIPKPGTLLKLVGGTPNDLYWRMLDACGEQPDALNRRQQLHLMLRENDSFAPLPVRFTLFFALTMVLRFLTLICHLDSCHIDFRSEGAFAIDRGEDYPVMVFIPLDLQSRNPVEILEAATNGLALGIVNWPISTSIYVLLTNDATVFTALKHMPIETLTLAIALAKEDGSGFLEQRIIEPLDEYYRSKGPFPIDLTSA